MGWLLLLLSCVSLTENLEHLVSPAPPVVIEVITLGEPYQKAKWKDNPTIRICKTAEVPTYRVAQAMRYWEGVGYEFDGLRTDPFSTCMHPRIGEILITLPESGFGDTHMASTRIYTHPERGDIVKAKIHVLPKNARKDRVIEHEIGHAMGWSHYRKKFHIMHPSWHLGGYDHSGIRR